MLELSGISIAMVIVIALYLSIVLRQWRKKFNLQQQQIKSLQQDLRSLCRAAVNVGERLGGMERESGQLSREQKILSQKQSQKSININTAGESSFDHAFKLAKKGISAEEMSGICNVTRGEADLIAMMHRLEHGEQSKPL